MTASPARLPGASAWRRSGSRAMMSRAHRKCRWTYPTPNPAQGISLAHLRCYNLRPLAPISSRPRWRLGNIWNALQSRASSIEGRLRRFIHPWRVILLPKDISSYFPYK